MGFVYCFVVLLSKFFTQPLINNESKFCVERFKSKEYTNRFVTPSLQGSGGSIGV